MNMQWLDRKWNKSQTDDVQVIAALAPRAEKNETATTVTMREREYRQFTRQQTNRTAAGSFPSCLNDVYIDLCNIIIIN